MIPISSDELTNRAFQLAYFLHCERKAATEIATRALNKLQLAATAQGKRLYYRLTGRADARKSRSKVSLGEPHLLQRLVYIESEEYERRKEAAALNSHSDAGTKPARQADLVVYFVKHLVRITTKRNSFYVTLGLSRLLYNYTTPETMELYNLVIQDPERVHDDYYYRSRKGVLLKELTERFGALVEVARGARGEQRWQAGEHTSRHAELVRECLFWFTPWATPCVVPERFDPLNDTIQQLTFAGRQPDEEHEVEVNRIHAALHPDCFARLAAANHLDAPGERLELPHFYLADQDHDPDDSPRTPPTVSADELRAINDLLAQETARRKAASAGFFRVLVDGEQRSEINLHHSASANFDVDDGVEVIEVYGADARGPLLMATHVLNFAAPETQTSTITLERGQRFSFTTSLSPDGRDGAKNAEITVSYEAPAPGFWAPARRAEASLANLARDMTLAPSAWWKPALALATLALLSIGIWWAWSRHNQTPPIELVSNTPSPTALSPAPPSPPAPSPTHGLNPPEQRRQPRDNQEVSPPPQVAQNPTAPSHEPDETLVTRAIVRDSSTGANEVEPSRGWDRTLMGKPLGEVRQVFVQTVNDDDRSINLRALLRAQLAAASGLQSSESDQADAALKISVRPASQVESESRVIATVRLVNANGYTVWPVSTKGSSWRYVGRPGYVADRMVADLKRDILRKRNR